MRIAIVSVGDVRQDYYAAACADYSRRLLAYSQVELLSVKPEPLRGSLSKAQRRQAIEAEGERLLGRLASPGYNVVLDGRGKQYTSRGLARHLNTLLVSGRSDWTFVIGGPLGLSGQVRDACDLVLSLSKLTFPHELVPVLLLEQLYRSFKLIRGEPYHY